MGRDTLFGDAGNDQLGAGVSFNMTSDGSKDSLVGGDGTDSLFGNTSPDHDVLTQ